MEDIEENKDVKDSFRIHKMISFILVIICIPPLIAGVIGILENDEFYDNNEKYKTVKSRGDCHWNYVTKTGYNTTKGFIKSSVLIFQSPTDNATVINNKKCSGSIKCEDPFEKVNVTVEKFNLKIDEKIQFGLRYLKKQNVPILIGLPQWKIITYDTVTNI